MIGRPATAAAGQRRQRRGGSGGGGAAALLLAAAVVLVAALYYIARIIKHSPCRSFLPVSIFHNSLRRVLCNSPIFTPEC